jgi:hypothetical protein
MDLNARNINFVRELVSRFPRLKSLLSEHTADNFGEILPHVFFGDITRYVLSFVFAIEAGKASDEDRRELVDILKFLELSYSTNEDIQELISVSFLELLPRPEEKGAGIRDILGPELTRELKIIG